VNRRGQGAEARARLHRQRHLRDHLAGMPRDERRPDDRVLALPDVHLEEAFGSPVEHGPVALRLLDRVGVDRHALRLGVLRVEADVGDFRVGVGAPGNRQRAGTLAPEEERVLDDDARHGVGGVGELVARAMSPAA
jgi:hypothetical protein